MKFRGKIEDLHAVSEWARAVCYLAYGPVKGEAHFRRLPAKAILSLWARR